MKIRLHQFNWIKHLFIIIIKCILLRDNTIYKENVFLSECTFSLTINFKHFSGFLIIFLYFGDKLSYNWTKATCNWLFTWCLFQCNININSVVAEYIVLLSAVMVERLCVLQVDTIFKCSLILMKILMCFIFQFYDNLNWINWKDFCDYLLLLKCIAHDMHPTDFLC